MPNKANGTRLIPRHHSGGRGDTKPITATAFLLGMKPHPWQARAGGVGLARVKNRWRYPIVVVSVPRQSGKTRLAFIVCVDRCLRNDGAQVWYTAQSRMDAVLRFRELVRLLRASGLVEAPVASFHHQFQKSKWDYRVRSGIGAEEVEFWNGSQLRIFAPAEDSLHGSVTDLVVIDEARFFDAHQGDGLMAAVLPTQATRDGQVWITSTAGGPESVFLHRQMEVAKSTTSGHVALIEYGIGSDVPAGDLLDAVWRAHPAAGRPGGPRREALEVASEQMPAWQFAHEYGNRWRTEADIRVLPAPVWEACRHDDPLPDGRPVFAADIPLDRSESVIVGCVDGIVEVVDTMPAAAVPDRLVDLVGQWDPLSVVVDAAGPAGTVASRLQLVCPDRLKVTSTRELAAACQGFYDAVTSGTARVRPSLVLNASAAMAHRRTVGQAWVWSRVDGGAPLVAVSLAMWEWSRQIGALATKQDWVAF